MSSSSSSSSSASAVTSLSPVYRAPPRIVTNDPSDDGSNSEEEAEARLEKILSIEEIDVNLYRGYSPEHPRWGRVYGGQTCAQSLVAAYRTVAAPLVAHSLHAYFLLPGSDDIPILYQVERLKEGGSFASRRVTGIQNGKAIFTMTASFQIPEVGLEHSDRMPSAPAPHTLPSLLETMKELAVDERLPVKVRAGLAKTASQPFAMDLRRVIPRTIHERYVPGQPDSTVWMRVCGRLSDSLIIHQCAIAYLSDWTLLETTLLPHGVHGHQNSDTQFLQIASIDHSMYFHSPCRADEFLLVVMHSSRASNGRGLAHSNFYRRDGTLAVTAMQEGLIRVRRGSDAKRVAMRSRVSLTSEEREKDTKIFKSKIPAKL